MYYGLLLFSRVALRCRTGHRSTRLHGGILPSHLVPVLRHRNLPIMMRLLLRVLEIDSESTTFCLQDITQGMQDIQSPTHHYFEVF
jgi:hypothetical protein